MTALVVDASIAVKWFFPEVHHAAALRVLKSRRELLAPDLIWAEFTNVLRKKVRLGEIEEERAGRALKDFGRFPVDTYPSRTLSETAWYLTRDAKVSVYDALYLALAAGTGATLVTADRKFYETFEKSRLGMKFLWVEDI